MTMTAKPFSAATWTRRRLLKGAAAGATAAITGPFFSRRVLGANDRVTMAVIGIRGQGTAHIDGFGGIPGVQVKTLCDIDENLYAGRLADLAKKHPQQKPGTESDLRRVFDDKDIDAVSFAVPNCWHALGAIWAAQAKKHVYVEKPACHTIWEGRQMVHAARKNNVLMQVGFQNRSRRNTTAAIDFIRAGKLGKVFMARGLCYKPRGNIGRYPDGPMAEGSVYRFTTDGAVMPTYTQGYLDKVHYDLWQGPNAVRPFNPNRFHYNWHWQWAYGNGDTGNQGPHQFDVARWGLGKNEHPVRVRSSGGLFLYGDSQQETPNTQTSTYEYADGTILEFATRGLYTNSDGGVRIGDIFYGSEGRLEIDDAGNWKTYFGPKSEPGPDSKSIVEEKSNALSTVGTGISGHFGNFIEAVKTGARERLNCDIEEGYRSSVLPHLGNIAYRLKREVKWDGAKEQFIGDAEANKMLHRQDRKGFQIPKLGPTGLTT